jgi:hypothetical protein
VTYRATGAEEGGGTNTLNDHPLSVSWTVLAADHETCDTVVPDPCAAVAVPAAPVFDHSPNGDNGWDIGAPTIVATSTDATVSYSIVSGGPYSATPPTLVEGEQTVYAIATSLTCNKTSGETSEVYKLDTVNPLIEITSPADGWSTLASVMTLSGTTSDATSGVASVTVNGDAATVDTGAGTFSRSGVALSCGSNAISAEATDNAGRTGSDSISVYRRCFTGSFLQPLDPNGVLNKAKLGRVVPVKLTITANDGGSIPTPVYLGYRNVPRIPEGQLHRGRWRGRRGVLRRWLGEHRQHLPALGRHVDLQPRHLEAPRCGRRRCVLPGRRFRRWHG